MGHHKQWGPKQSIVVHVRVVANKIPRMSSRTSHSFRSKAMVSKTLNYLNPKIVRLQTSDATTSLDRTKKALDSTIHLFSCNHYTELRIFPPWYVPSPHETTRMQRETQPVTPSIPYGKRSLITKVEMNRKRDFATRSKSPPKPKNQT